MSARDYQRAAIDAMFSYWNEGGGNPLVDMATGTGKSVVISTLIREMLELWPDLRILALVHVKELVDQNAKALRRTWPASVAITGINSAGLGRRDLRSQILFASIQSVYKLGERLGKRDLVLIDEAHLTPRAGEGMYRQLLEALRSLVPDMRVAGFTATPYRLDSGRLDAGDERLFDEIVYTYGIGDGVRDGWLSPLVSKKTGAEIDVSGVAKRGGEFVAGDLERAADQDEITQAAVAEIVERGQDRKSWIVFCAGVKHALNVRDAIRARGISCETVTGDTPSADRDRIIKDFRAGRIRCLTNAMVLTTGFDAPGVDLIAMLRPTLSTGLYVQKLGRGTRPVYPDGFDPNGATAEERIAAIAAGPKPNCLVLDFSGNVRRHGPVDAIVVAHGPKKRGDEDDEEMTGRVKEGDIRAKECPECHSLVAKHLFECRDCGFCWPEPPKKPAHEKTADDTPVMVGGEKQSTSSWSDVGTISFDRNEPRDPMKPPTLRVEYVCGLTIYKEWVCFEHQGFPRQKAEAWWRKMRGTGDVPETVDEALDRVEDGDIQYPSAIVVRARGDFDDIIGRRFDGQRPQLHVSWHRRRQHGEIVRPRSEPCWAVLRLRPDATVHEIKSAFRQLAKEVHPDMGGTHEAMAALNTAYERAIEIAEFNEVFPP